MKDNTRVREAMLASELIAVLVTLVGQFGDLYVYSEADWCWVTTVEYETPQDPKHSLVPQGMFILRG